MNDTIKTAQLNICLLSFISIFLESIMPALNMLKNNFRLLSNEKQGGAPSHVL